MLDFQRYIWNLNLTKIVEDNVVFLTRKVLISVSFSIAYYKQEMYKLLFKENKKELWYLCLLILDQTLHKGSLEFTLTVPLRKLKKKYISNCRWKWRKNTFPHVYAKLSSLKYSAVICYLYISFMFSVGVSYCQWIFLSGDWSARSWWITAHSWTSRLPWWVQSIKQTSKSK